MSNGSTKTNPEAAFGSVQETTSALVDALARSEFDLAQWRDNASCVKAEAARLTTELDLLQGQFEALERRLHEQQNTISDQDAALDDIRRLLTDSTSSRDQAQAAFDAERAKTAALQRQVAELFPKAESNEFALKTVRNLSAECTQIGNERHALAAELEQIRSSRSWRLVEFLRRTAGVLPWMTKDG